MDSQDLVVIFCYHSADWKVTVCAFPAIYALDTMLDWEYLPERVAEQNLRTILPPSQENYCGLTAYIYTFSNSESERTNGIE